MESIQDELAAREVQGFALFCRSMVEDIVVLICIARELSVQIRRQDYSFIMSLCLITGSAPCVGKGGLLRVCLKYSGLVRTVSAWQGDYCTYFPHLTLVNVVVMFYCIRLLAHVSLSSLKIQFTVEFSLGCQLHYDLCC